MGDDRGSEALAREPDRLKLSPVRQIRVVYGDVFLPVQIADVLGGGGAHGRVMFQISGLQPLLTGRPAANRLREGQLTAAISASKAENFEAEHIQRSCTVGERRCYPPRTSQGARSARPRRWT
jgi:hypothetical protein